MTLGEKIKQARTENGFTQEELAEKLMVSHCTMQERKEYDAGTACRGEFFEIAQGKAV